MVAIDQRIKLARQRMGLSKSAFAWLPTVTKADFSKAISL